MKLDKYLYNTLVLLGLTVLPGSSFVLADDSARDVFSTRAISQDPGSFSGGTNPGEGGGNGGGASPAGNNGNQNSQYNDNDLINDPTYNDEWALGSVERLQKNLDLTTELANEGLKELDQEELKQQEITDYGRELAQKTLDTWSEREVEQKYNSPFGITAWPRSTYEPINIESTENFDGTCHAVFRDVFSSDKGQQLKFFADPKVSLTTALMDLPYVKLESARKLACTGTSCGGGGGNEGSGVLRCFKHNKGLGLIDAGSMANPMIAKKKETQANANLPESGEANMEFLQSLQFFPDPKDKTRSLVDGQTESGDVRVCMDFANFLMPFNAVTYTSKAFASYRALAALQEGLNASSYFQALSSEDAEGDTSAALPIGMAIQKNDRFFGLEGNFVKEVAPGFMTCPTVDEMVEKMKSSPLGALAFKDANKVDVENSEYQAFTRYPVFKCGGGRYFRGLTLLLDQSKNLCQTDKNAKPYSVNRKGTIYTAFINKEKIAKFWQFEIPQAPILTPLFTTKVC